MTTDKLICEFSSKERIKVAWERGMLFQFFKWLNKRKEKSK
jgi:hypothetical protein